MPRINSGATEAWIDVLSSILMNGEKSSPRGKPTLEVISNHTAFDMNYPVVQCEPRKLSYKFMNAEALWILQGDDSVKGIAPWNKAIAKFSDDGERFFGAYGPKVVDQIPYVVRTLLGDISTRQAVMTIWRENPPKTKDVPCTLSLHFLIRGSQLDCHVTMRSSDAWLGVPYDFFNFSMIAATVLRFFNLNWAEQQRGLGDCTPICSPGCIVRSISLGNLYWTASSSHLYERNWPSADLCLDHGSGDGHNHPPIPVEIIKGTEELEPSLRLGRTLNRMPAWIPDHL